ATCPPELQVSGLGGGLNSYLSRLPLATAVARPKPFSRTPGAPGRLQRLSLGRYDSRLDEIDHPGLEVGAVEPINLLGSRGRGHVHLGQVVADDVESNEVESVALEPRPHHRANLAVARGNLGLYAITADVDVAAVLVVALHPQRASEGFAVEHDQALVAVADFG